MKSEYTVALILIVVGLMSFGVQALSRSEAMERDGVIDPHLATARYDLLPAHPRLRYLAGELSPETIRYFDRFLVMP